MHTYYTPILVTGCKKISQSGKKKYQHSKQMSKYNKENTRLGNVDNRLFCLKALSYRKVHYMLG